MYKQKSIEKSKYLISHDLSESVNRIGNRMRVGKCVEERRIMVKVDYGEVVLKHAFSYDCCVEEVHLHFFREMITL